MTAFFVELAIPQGSSFERRFAWTRNGAPVDLTACTARLQVRPFAEAAEVLLDLNTENGGIALGGLAGTIDVVVSDELSAGFDWRAGVHDLEIYQGPTGLTRRLFEGPATVSPNVTRPT